jgi:hypothetical protein
MDGIVQHFWIAHGEMAAAQRCIDRLAVEK